MFSLPDLQHAQIDLASYRGKVVLLNFWATWCAPCRLEMPRFAAWQSQYAAQGFKVIGASIDDAEPPVQEVLTKMHLNYPVVMGNPKLGELYGGVYGVPVTFLIDRDGIVRARYSGESNLPAMEIRIRHLLAERAP